jgi:rubrerythrin
MKDSEPCDHLCGVDCQAILEAIEREEAMVAFYDTLAAECDYPDAHALVAELAERRHASVEMLRRRFNEINSRFDPAGC